MKHFQGDTHTHTPLSATHNWIWSKNDSWHLLDPLTWTQTHLELHFGPCSLWLFNGLFQTLQAYSYLLIKAACPLSGGAVNWLILVFFTRSTCKIASLGRRGKKNERVARAKRQILGAPAILVCVSSLVLHSKVQWRFILLSASQITGWKQLSQSQASIPAVAQQMVRVYRER